MYRPISFNLVICQLQPWAGTVFTRAPHATTNTRKQGVGYTARGFHQRGREERGHTQWEGGSVDEVDTVDDVDDPE